MLASIHSATVLGVNGSPVTVEVFVGPSTDDSITA